MPTTHLAFSSGSIHETLADVIVVAAYLKNGKVVIHGDSVVDVLADQLADVGFRGGKDELVRLPRSTSDVPPIAVIGLDANAGPDELRYAAGSAVRQLAGTEFVAFAIPVTRRGDAEALATGAALGSYAFTTYRSASLGSVKAPVSSIVIYGSVDAPEDVIGRASAIADAVALVKDLVNTPAADLYPETFADIALQRSADLPVEVTVWDELRLAEDGFGGILGVGQGSSRGPRLVKVSYNPPEARNHLALVGKGITFDTGGLSLKPPTGMVGMKYDMTGAATVLAVALAVARLSMPIRLTAWLCLAENMPSGTAIRPNDVLRIRGGRTVEVLNTDAEGRLVLADGLVAASEEQPDAIVDVATLTGAAMVALGTRYAAVMGDQDLITSVLAAANATGELLWPMPLPDELRATINSDVADIANANPGVTAGGMLLAGIFLQEFVGDQEGSQPQRKIPWAHLDIAGPAKSPSSPFGFTGKGATGVTVRALISLADEISRR